MTPILSTKRLTKCYGLEYANRDIDVEFHLGRVHALIGENGAGKSTLMKMLFGLEKPTAGEIYHSGELVRISSPQVAKSMRIAMVHQHFMLAENLTISDHLRLEVNSRNKNWWIGPYYRFSDKIRELQNLLQLNVSLDTAVKRLSVIQKQKLEILKTLLFDPEIIFFDEPTAVLPPREVREFYSLVEKLKTKPTGIVIVTHKLEEVINYADEVTVLRHGLVKLTSKVNKTSAAELARHMVGEENEKSSIPDDPKLNTPIESSPSRKSLLQVNNFSLVHPSLHVPLKEINLEVMSGEIVAFAGVEGNGQSELLNGILFPELYAGATGRRTHSAEGEIELLGQTIVHTGAAKLDHVAIRKMSLGWIGEDRLSQSAIPDFYLPDHFRLLPHHRRYFRLKPISSEKLKESQQQFDIRPLRLNMSLAGFSGGNQQKWVVARETSHAPELLIAAHPTRGVDFAAAKRIHDTFRELRARNKGVIFLSSDLDEICDLADRIFIFFRGRVTKEFERPFSRERIGEEMGGHDANKPVSRG